MPHTVETVVYAIEELPETAKERARAWYRETCLDHEWYDAVFEDFEAICRILGVTLRTSPVRLMGGGTRDRSPTCIFRGFSSQGDGASFEGAFSHARGSARAIRAHAPKDEELHRIADELQAAQKRNFYQLNAAPSGRAATTAHEHSMAIEVERDSPTWQPMTDGAKDTVIEALRDFARWLYRQLQREYEYLTTDAVVEETIGINRVDLYGAGPAFRLTPPGTHPAPGAAGPQPAASPGPAPPGAEAGVRPDEEGSGRGSVPGLPHSVSPPPENRP